MKHRRRNYRAIAIQALTLLFVIAVVVGMAITANRNLSAMGITNGFAFLERPTGWDLSFSLIDYQVDSTYGRALFVGLLNTLLSASMALSFATVLGTMVGVARISRLGALRLLSTIYVELFRNIPLLLQVLFWYALFLKLPTIRAAEPFLGGFLITNRGFYFPTPVLSGGALLIASLTAMAIFAGVIIVIKRSGRFDRGVGALIGWVLGLTAATASLFIVALIFREPGASIISTPAVAGLRIKGGGAIVPELSALVLGLTLFGAAYIGEIVRGGFNSVPKGLVEAGAALGIRPATIFWKIRAPLALRAIIPPMSNQYVWLLKGTAVGLAIGFTDLFMISSVSINQTGQTLEILFIMMLGFFVINYTISSIMNFFNRKLALKGYSDKK